MPKKTLEEVLNDFKKTHGNRYDYSKVNYKKTHEKVIIICKKHGEFEQTPASHKMGFGCIKCGINKASNSRLKSSDEIIQEFKKIHKNRYDYSLVNYKGAHKKVIIICKKHGNFSQTPQSHKKGSDCPKCVGKEKLNTKGFILKAKEIHGNRYDYSKTKYKNANEKVTIICKEHGEFKVRAISHYFSKIGCLKCSYIERGKKIRLKKEEVLKKFKQKHNDKYDYSKVDFIKTSNKVIIICRDHGEFKMTPRNHIIGQGCPKCGIKSRTYKRRSKITDVINSFKNFHGNRYDYSEVIYKNNNTKVKIICKKHGVFDQTPTAHKIGQGCPKCAKEYIDSLMEERRITQSEYVDRANKIHQNRYKYDNINYKGMFHNINITCPIHGDWNTRAGNHVNGTGCPYCELTPQSKQELTITFELIKIFTEINPKGFKTKINGKLWSIDIYIPELNLGIEFDGNYWHKNKVSLDKLKTEKLKTEGFEIYRVREEPLKKIFKNDIISKLPFNGKKIVDDILKQIMKNYNLNTNVINKIKKYLNYKNLQNQNGLSNYIDLILTEKASRK